MDTQDMGIKVLGSIFHSHVIFHRANLLVRLSHSQHQNKPTLLNDTNSYVSDLREVQRNVNLLLRLGIVLLQRRVSTMLLLRERLVIFW